MEVGKFSAEEGNFIIHPSAKVGKNLSIGYFTIIEKDVEIGDDCILGHNVAVREGTKIGNGVRIDSNTVVGKTPIRSKRSAFLYNKKYPPAMIGNEVLIGAQVSIYVGCEIGNDVLIADSASVREEVKIGDFTIVGRSCTVENFVTIGKHCKLETNSYITAYSLLEDYIFVAPGVVTTNDNFMGRGEKRFDYFKGVTVRKGGRLGGGCVILPGIEIGEDAVVAAGSIVTKNVPPGVIVAGIPAKYFRDTPEDQLLKNQGWE